ncbi:hypothetical protein Sps_01239 [Shewanella psychrophila]|uniref:Uncharacterized protein n=1 Tax=Shewanella psychrophila TaxID=225848 RepID=A0A1S6HLM9_9GAMM|nr:hypothetical protein Sps_01239 [Shewanella psychrophila]
MNYLEMITLKAHSVHSSMYLGISTIMYLLVTILAIILTMEINGLELGLTILVLVLNLDKIISQLQGNIIH